MIAQRLGQPIDEPVPVIGLGAADYLGKFFFKSLGFPTLWHVVGFYWIGGQGHVVSRLETVLTVIPSDAAFVGQVASTVIQPASVLIRI